MLQNTSEKDKNKLISLYNSAFPNEAEFCDAFFNTVWKPEYSYISTQDGFIRSMITLIPFELFSDRSSFKAYYIYAAATEKSCRNSGEMTYLIQETEKIIKSRGADFSILIVGNDSLFDFYEKFGFSPLNTVQKKRVSACLMPVNAEKATPADYKEIIRLYESETAEFTRIKRDESFLYELSRLYKSDFYLLRENGKIISYIFGYKENNTLKIIEAIGEKSETLSARTAKLFNCNMAEYVTPSVTGIPIGMAKALSEKASTLDLPVYINLLYN